MIDFMFFFSSRRRHTRCALVTGVQTCALPICTPWTIVSPWNNLSPDPSCNLTNPAAIGALRLLRDRLLPGSSAVEQPAVNRLVDGSNPFRGATLFKAKNAPYQQVTIRPHTLLHICSHNFAGGIQLGRAPYRDRVLQYV